MRIQINNKEIQNNETCVDDISESRHTNWGHPMNIIHICRHVTSKATVVLKTEQDCEAYLGVCARIGRMIRMLIVVLIWHWLVLVLEGNSNLILAVRCIDQQNNKI